MSTAEGTRPRLRPLSLGEILDVAIKICLRHWRALLKAVLVIAVPVELVSTLLTADYTAHSFDFSSGSSQTSGETIQQLNHRLEQELGGVAISTLLRIIAVTFVFAACFRMIAQAYLGDQPDWRASLGFAFRRTPSLLLVTLLYGLGIGVATVFFVAPGVWLYVAWAFSLPALLVEGKRGTGALGRSFSLVTGRWWRTFGVIAVGFILAGVVSTIVQAIFYVGIVVEPDNHALVIVLATIAGILGLAIGTPFQAALLTVIYFDLRVRKEGFDLELLASGIDGTVPVIGDGMAPSPLPYYADVDRTGAPYWPPPPGWTPPPPGTLPAQPPPVNPAVPPYWPPPPGWKPPEPSNDDPPTQLPGVPNG